MAIKNNRNTILILPGIGVNSVIVVASNARNMTAKVVTELLFICRVFEIRVNNIKDFHPCQIIDAKALIK
jgi:hypothetical protein